MSGAKFQHVTKRFGDSKDHNNSPVYAVNDLSLDIPDGEFLVLVGPSGSGKSTALRMLAGLEEPTEGTIWIGDRVVNNVAPKDRNVAMVFQNYALYPHMDVFNNMAFSLKMARVPIKDIDRRIEEAARLLSIEPLLKRKPSQLSGGQRQRVAVGRTIVREPEVFLFDEPLSNLDAQLRVETRAQLSELHSRLGTTFVYVTHDQVEAMTLATRIAVLKDGILQQVDTPGNLYDRPANVFVAGFIGSPSMNFFSSTLTGTQEEMYADTGSFRVKVPGQLNGGGALNTFLDKTVILGVRPEDIYDRQYLATGVSGEPVTATVSFAELAGSEDFLHLETADKKTHFVARVDRRSGASAGKSIDLLYNMQNAHFFDPNTNQAIQ
jgi:multiple sugar transport system ATP-binding protein